MAQEDNFDIDKIEADLKALDERMNKTEAEGFSDLIKYFDRIHDKIFQLNTIIIGGYFALIAIQPATSVWFITIPLANLLILLYVDYKMMEKSRLQSNIKSLGPDQIQKYGRIINNTNLYSLACIFATSIVLIIFAVLLIKNGIPTK